MAVFTYASWYDIICCSYLKYYCKKYLIKLLDITAILKKCKWYNNKLTTEWENNEITLECGADYKKMTYYLGKEKWFYASWFKKN